MNMTDGEPHPQTTPLPKKRKYARNAKAAAPKPASEFEGVTTHNCCLGCSEKKCVITGSNVCGHPLKASHSGAEPNVLRRIEAVKKLLRIQKIEAS